MPWPRPAALGISLRYLTAQHASFRPPTASPHLALARTCRVLRAVGEIIARLELQPLVINGCLWAARTASAWLSGCGVPQGGGHRESFCLPPLRRETAETVIVSQIRCCPDGVQQLQQPHTALKSVTPQQRCAALEHSTGAGQQVGLVPVCPAVPSGPCDLR